VGNYWLIVGAGHCGTAWLAHVLDTAAPNLTFYHELKRAKVGMNWVRCTQYEERHGVNKPKYDGYWHKIRSQMEHGDVGDANAWLPLRVPEVNAAIPVSRVIYLVRHGISQLHSLATTSLVWSDPDDNRWAYDTLLAHYHEIAGGPEPDWKRWTDWEKLCFFWTTNVFMPEWLRGQGLNVEVTRFEDLTQKPARLLSFLPEGSNEAQALALQHQDINRHVAGSRNPADLWPQWTEEQQEAFRRICGAAMQALNYEIPE
jgi:hypothetical protein